MYRGVCYCKFAGKFFALCVNVDLLFEIFLRLIIAELLLFFLSYIVFIATKETDWMYLDYSNVSGAVKKRLRKASRSRSKVRIIRRRKISFPPSLQLLSSTIWTRFLLFQSFFLSFFIYTIRVSYLWTFSVYVCLSLSLCVCVCVYIFNIYIQIAQHHNVPFSWLSICSIIYYRVTGHFYVDKSGSTKVNSNGRKEKKTYGSISQLCIISVYVCVYI